MIETVYRVRCSGPCAGYLAVQLTEPTSYGVEQWAWDATDFEVQANASQVAHDAGWAILPRLDHDYHAGWLGPDSCCRFLPIVGMAEAACTRPVAAHAIVGPFCPDCVDGAREAMAVEAAQWWAEARARAAAASMEGPVDA